MSIFEGVFTALCTPFTADGSRICLDRLAARLVDQANGGVRGVVPCGTTGEAPTLKEHEHRALVERTVQVARAQGLIVIAGAGSNDTAHAVELHHLARSAGADAALHVCPYYNKPSQRGLFRHFVTIADSCDLPVVLYNIPGRTDVSLTIETVERLAGHENIQAIKESTGSLTLAGEILARTDLAVLSGDDPLTLPLLSIGASGVISVLSNVLPDRVSALCRAVGCGDLALAREIHGRLLPLATALLSLDSNPVPVKTALQILGQDTGALRSPLVPPSDDTIRTLECLLASVMREAPGRRPSVSVEVRGAADPRQPVS